MFHNDLPSNMYRYLVVDELALDCMPEYTPEVSYSQNYLIES